MNLILGLLFGSVGGVYLAYARKIHDPMFLICGFLLILYPYFFERWFLIIAIGLVLALFPIAKTRGWV